METSDKSAMDQAYFTDSNSPNVALTLEQLDYDNAKFPMAGRDQAAIQALNPSETYVVQYSEEEDDDEAPFWGTITRLPDDTTVRALVRNGAVLGMAFDDAAARQDAMDRGADPADVAAGEYVDGTLAALSGWGDVLIGPESVGVAPDGRVCRIDVVGDADDEERSFVIDESWINAAGITFVLADGGKAGRYFEMTASEGSARACFCREEALAFAEYLRSAGVDARPLKLTVLHARVVATGILIEGDPMLEAGGIQPVVLPRAECERVAAFLVAEAPKTNMLVDYFGPEEAEIFMAAWAWRDAPAGSEPAKGGS
jgi:hypothetical protein